MAIKDFGESILADVRKRKDDQRKRDEGGTLGKLQRGLKTVQDVAEIGQSFGLFGGTAEDKYNAFKTNKAVMDTNINIGRAETNAKFYDNLQTKIAEAGTSATEYFADQTINETVNKAIQHPDNVQYTLSDEETKKFRKAYSSSLRGTDRIKVAAALATKQYNEFGTVRDRFNQLGSKDEAMKLAKSKIPKALRSLGSIFTGEDLNQAAVDSYTTNLLAQGAAELEVFRQIFDETGGDLTQAVDLADNAGILKETLARATKQTTEHIDTGNGQIVSIQYETDISGNKKLVPGSAQRTDLRTEEQRVIVKKANFNPQSVIVSQLNKAGQIKAKEMGFFRGQVDTEAAYEKNVEILNKLLNAVDTDTGNTLYIKPIVSETDKSRNQLKGNLVAALYRDVDYLRAQTDVEKQSGFMAEEREKIVALNPKLGDKEIETLLLENENYKNAYASFTASTSTVINKQNSVNDVVNATFPLPSDPDNAETADIKAGSTPKPTSLIKLTGDTLGVRNKNLLNVRPNVDKNDPWLGQSGVNENYAVFESVDMGIRAGDKVLTTYGTKHNINTVEEVLKRFAPAADNNDTEAYIKHVSNKTGFARDEEIDLSDSSVRDALLSAMVKQETGEDVSAGQIRAAVIRANETEEGLNPTVTKEQVSAAVSGEISDEDITEWAKANRMTSLSIEDLRSGYGKDILKAKQFEEGRKEQKKKDVEAGIAFSKKLEKRNKKNKEENAKLDIMSRAETKYYRATGKFPARIVEMFKDGIPEPEVKEDDTPSKPLITKSNSSSSILGKMNKEISNFGVN